MDVLNIFAQDVYTVPEMKEVIVERITNQLRTLFAINKYAYNIIDAELTAIEDEVVAKISEDFDRLGLQITDFNITGTVFDEATVERILHLVQDLEPAGVGARDLQECLLLQLKHKTPSDSINLAIQVIEQQFAVA